MEPKSRVIVIDLAGEEEKDCRGCAECGCGKKELKDSVHGKVLELQESATHNRKLISAFGGIDERIASLQKRNKWPGVRNKKRLI